MRTETYRKTCMLKGHAALFAKSEWGKAELVCRGRSLSPEHLQPNHHGMLTPASTDEARKVLRSLTKADAW